jgi:hypothetical protein
VIRIDVPSSTPQVEGGAIELAAMLGPNGPLAATSNAALASVRPAASTPTVSFAAASESLRARAVVYNVSLTDDSGGASHDDETLVAPARDRRAAEGSIGDKPAGDQAQTIAPRPLARPAMRDDSRAAPAEADQAAVAPRPTTEAANQGEASAPNAETAASTRPAAYDAAFGDWDAAFGDWLDAQPMRSTDEPDEIGLSFAATRQHTLVGLAVAAALGAGPVLRRARRPKQSGLVEQAAGLK